MYMEAIVEEVTEAIVVDNVSKQYAAGTHALDGINLSIAQGEFVSLVGPSGCGKSTLLRIMAGLANSTRGTISVLGRDSLSSQKEQESLSFVFQEANLMPWRTVLRNVELPLEMRGVDKKTRRNKVMEVLQLVGLSGYANYYPRQLSGGMKMRVSIARALVSDPRVMFMDEPFGALDEMTRHRLHHELLDIWMKTKLTIVFVTHNVFEAIYLSNRVVVMNANPGRIKEVVTVDLPYPRKDEFQASANFGKSVEAVSTALKGGV